MQQLSHVQLWAVSGGEVRATGMGDNYHYTGEQPSFDDCVRDQAMDALKNYQLPDAGIMIYCAFQTWGGGYSFFGSR